MFAECQPMPFEHGSAPSVGWAVRTATAPRDARIAQVFVKQGAFVAAGQPLVALADEDLATRLTKKRSEVAALEAELAQAEANLTIELETRQAAIQAEIFETKLR